MHKKKSRVLCNIVRKSPIFVYLSKIKMKFIFLFVKKEKTKIL